MVPSVAQVRLSYVNGGFQHKLSLSSYYGLCGEVPKGVSFLGFRNIKGVGISLQTTRGARNPILQVFITHASHV